MQGSHQMGQADLIANTFTCFLPTVSCSLDIWVPRGVPLLSSGALFKHRPTHCPLHVFEKAPILALRPVEKLFSPHITMKEEVFLSSTHFSSIYLDQHKHRDCYFIQRAVVQHCYSDVRVVPVQAGDLPAAPRLSHTAIFPWGPHFLVSWNGQGSTQFPTSFLNKLFL